MKIILHREDNYDGFELHLTDTVKLRDPIRLLIAILEGDGQKCYCRRGIFTKSYDFKTWCQKKRFTEDLFFEYFAETAFQVEATHNGKRVWEIIEITKGESHIVLKIKDKFNITPAIVSNLMNFMAV